MRLLSWTALGAACVAAYVAFNAHAISSLVYPRAAEDGVDADGGVALARAVGIDGEGAEDEEGAASAAGERALIIEVPRAARKRHANASAAAPAWAHVFASAPGARLPDELCVPALGVDRRRASALSAAKEFGGQYRRARLSRARAVPALADAPRNLLTGELAPHAANFSAPGDEHARNYWVPQLRVRFVAQPHAFPEDGLIPEIAHYAVWTRAREWLPVLHIDDAWVTKSQLAMCLNESTPTAPLGVSVGAIGLGRWRLYNLLEHQVGEQLKAMGGGDDDVDDVKEMLVLANPKMLALSLVVTVLHMFFEFLAVQADVRWWRERKDRRSMAGVSVRSVLMVAFCQLVVYLYVLEQKASLLVTVPMTIGVAVEMWKVVRALRGMTLGWRGLRLKDEEPYGANEVNRHTLVKLDEYDGQSAMWLNAMLYPLAVCYSGYTLVYGYHRSWYSWLIGSLYRCVFVAGFVAMTPQIFLNHKLQSVAAMPWEAMLYKFFNTFIDDLYALLIPMPTMHRLMCLRDDVIFFIFLWQRWKYRIDADRPIQM
eukprot:PRCOL_00005640-RA